MTIIKINQQRLWNTLMHLGEIGKDVKNKGVTRMSLSPLDQEARQYVIQLMKQSGLHVRIDHIGNIIGKWEGTDPQAPVVIAGSHIDSVLEGGMFDGPLGVLGAVEAVRTLQEQGIKLTHSIEIISFTDEEGTRFGTGFIGSKAMIGDLKEEELQFPDAEGITYSQALEEAGFDPKQYKQVIRKPEEIKAYLELHIEQGRVLETENLSVGIVTDIQGPLWLNVRFKGQSDHAGATPMNIRRDASLAMAEVLPVIEQVAIKWDGVATVGKMHFKPGGINIIPEEVVFSIDMRHVNKEKRQLMKREIYEIVEKTADKRELEANIDVHQEVDPVTCTPRIVQTIETACQELNIPVYKMKCGAGHDALLMSKITDFGMIFVRSEQGISHNPKEWSSPEDCADGAQVLMETLRILAQ